MRKSISFLVLTAISLAFIFTACKKDDPKSYDEDEYLKAASYSEVDLILDKAGDFEKVITKPLVKLDGCKFIVEGSIEFHKEGELLAVFDFGDGLCDDIATKTVHGVTTEFSLRKAKGAKEKFEKVIVEPIVKLDGCDYIVSGVIEFYSLPDNEWLASIDFGNGSCDEWATKRWNGGSKEFSMKTWKGK